MRLPGPEATVERRAYFLPLSFLRTRAVHCKSNNLFVSRVFKFGEIALLRESRFSYERNNQLPASKCDGHDLPQGASSMFASRFIL